MVKMLFGQRRGRGSRSRPVVRVTLGSLVLHCPLHMLVKSGYRCHLGMTNKCSDKINRCSRLYQLWLIDCHQLMTGLLQSNAISEGQWDLSENGYFFHLSLLLVILEWVSQQRLQLQFVGLLGHTGKVSLTASCMSSALWSHLRNWDEHGLEWKLVL